MDKRIAFAFLALLLVLPIGFAQETKFVAKPIKTIHLVGNGIAINSTDPMDFMHAKAVIGAVRLTAAEDNSFTVKRLGVLVLDNKVYHLKNIAVSLNEMSADVFEKDSTEGVGKIYVARYEKPGRDIWAGDLSLNNSLYNVYFLGLKRKFTLMEAARKIGDYCKENPNDNMCQSIAAKCAQNPRACKAKLVNFCKENPRDKRCIALNRAYCLRNAADVRCRQFLLKRCEENADAPFCNVKKIAGRRIVSIRPDMVKAVEEKDMAKGVLKKIVPVRKRWQRAPLVDLNYVDSNVGQPFGE